MIFIFLLLAASESRGFTVNVPKAPVKGFNELVYFDNVSPESDNPQENFYPGPSDVPKVAAQQVLYEYQQTPTDSVSNVHVKQLFEPQENSYGFVSLETSPNQYVAQSVALPAHHNGYINHGAPYYHPLYNINPNQYKQNQYIPEEVLHAARRRRPRPNPNNPPNRSPAFYQNQQRIPLNYNRPPNQRLRPPPPVANFYNAQQAQSYSRFQTPQHYQRITHPMTIPTAQNEEQQADEEEEEPATPEDADSENYEEEDRKDYDKNPVYGKYQFERESDEEEDENPRYENDEESSEEDEDSNKGSSSYKYRKYPKPKKSRRGSRIEAHHSEQVPITQKHQIFKEKWYLTKESDGKLNRSSKKSF